MIDLWKCAKCGTALEVDDELLPDCRLVQEYEGHTCFGKLHLEQVDYLHCLNCEKTGQCRICNVEPGLALEHEQI